MEPCQADWAIVQTGGAGEHGRRACGSGGREDAITAAVDAAQDVVVVAGEEAITVAACRRST